MSRASLSLALALLAVALVAVPAASAKGRDHRAVRIQGVCSQQSTSTLKLRREDRGIELELEVDQNRSGIPWTVTLSRNGDAVKTFTATTRAPSGSFEVRRVIAGHLRTDRFTAVATNAAGETCTADTSAPRATPGAAPAADDNSGADDGHHSGAHS